MKTSCVNQPANEPLVIIRQWQIEFCDGNTTAAALLSFFEYWHNVKLDAAKQNQKANDTAARHGEQPSQDTSLYQWHTEDDLTAGIMGIAKSPKTITAALGILVEKGAISIHRNPSPRFKFDNTRHFLFYPDVVNVWLENRPGNFTLSSSKNASRQGKKDLRSGKNTETLSEITTETTKQIGAAPTGNPSKPTKPELSEQEKDELLVYGLYGRSHNKTSVDDPTLQATRDIETVWKRRITDDVKTALVYLTLAIRTVNPGFMPPGDKTGQGAWGKGATEHLETYSLDELRRLYPKAITYNAEHRLNYFRPQSLTETMKRLKYGFGENGSNGNGTYNTVTSTGAVKIL